LPLHCAKCEGQKFLIQLGKRIRGIRLEKGLSQVDVGIAMDNYGEQIGRIERGELNVTICTLKKIAEVLDIPLSELVTIQ
jgi:transcriptional regulator with XRE-family HTH domain